MRILIDTNVLCRLVEAGHSQHDVADGAVMQLLTAGHELCVVPQVIYEYWVVATRPRENNGLGMPASLVDSAIDRTLEVFTMLLDERGVFANWRSLVRTYEVKGKAAHDARLVAAMNRHGITLLLTFNADDFARFEQLSVRTPATVLSDRGWRE